MSHGHRFYLPGLILEEAPALSGDEARHAAKVLRLREGDSVTLMDGKGMTRKYLVNALRPGEVALTAAEPPFRAPLPSARPFLLLGAPDPKALEELLPHAVELGAFHIAIARSERSQFAIGHFERRRERLEKIVISGLKQSGNPFLPRITFHGDIESALEPAPTLGYLLDRDAPPLPRDVVSRGEFTICIGPEGDFSPGEKKVFENRGLRRVSIAPYTLRVETAVLAALSVFTSLAGVSGSWD